MSESKKPAEAVLVTLAVGICSAIQQIHNEMFAHIEDFLSDENMDAETFLEGVELIITLARMNAEADVATAVMKFNPALALELAMLRAQDPNVDIREQLTASILNLKFRNS